MHTTHFRELFQYNNWANQQVWECIAALDDEQFRRPLDYSVGSIQEQVLHTMNVELRFFHFFRTNEWILFALDRDPLLNHRTAIRQRWDEIAVMADDYLSAIHDADLLREMTYQFSDGVPRKNQVWQLMMQVYGHSMDHRAQILAMLHQLGAPTVSQDYIRYLGQRNIES